METEKGLPVGRPCWSPGCLPSEGSASPPRSSGRNSVLGNPATCVNTNAEM